MRKLILLGSVLAVGLIAAAAYAQTRCGSNLCVGGPSTPVVLEGSGERVSTARPNSGSYGVHCEIGSSTLSGGAATVTFARAFAAAPICVATDTTAANAVRAHTPLTTGFSLAGTTTDVINWNCCGSR